MYCDEFGFSERPFDVTPDPTFLFLGEGHREVLAALQYGITEQRGFILLTGEVGTGKTTLLNTLKGKLGQDCQIAYIFNTNLNFEELLNTALFEWKVTDKNEKLTIGPAIDAINDYAIEQLGLGNKVILIIDEAQNLDIETLENIRLLSNLETNKQKLIQILLAGQPELDTKLSLNQLRQLQQRINIKRCLWPLTRKETFAYIDHRIKVASNGGGFQITQGAKQVIWRFSTGIPRKINTLADNALLLCYGLYKDKLDKKTVREAVKDIQQDSSTVQWSLFSMFTPPLPKISSIFLTAFLVGTIVVGGLWAVDNKPEMLSHSVDLDTLHQEEAGKISSRIQSEVNINSERKPSVLKEDDSKKRTEIPLELPLVSQPKSAAPPEPLPLSEGIKNSTPIPPVIQTKNEIQASSPLIMTSEAKDYIEVVVMPGDILSQLVKDNLGTFKGFPLGKFLAYNPEIKDPDNLKVNQIIKIPINKKNLKK